MKRGFTLVEFLVVLSILAVIVALVSPVVFKGRESSKVTASVLRGKQIHAAYMLYQQDAGGYTGAYGEPSEMNLPPDGMIIFKRRLYGMTPELQLSPCGQLRTEAPIGGIYLMLYERDSEQESLFSQMAKRYREGVGLTLDFHCNPDHPHFNSPRVTKRAVVVRLDGGVFVRQAKAAPYDFDAWFNREEN